MGNKIDLTNQRFGKLTVLYELPERVNKRILWHCKCDCGKEIDVIGSNLKRGNTKSCGCLRHNSPPNKEDLANQQFGLLKVINVYQKDKQGRTYYNCLCQCGNYKNVRSDHLKSGKIISCGCYHRSKGEDKIKQILINNKIPFEEQKTFFDCRDQRPLPFDFYVNNQYIIEYDGIQHFKPNGGWNKQDNVLKVQQHDKIKNQYCKEHNIPIIRVPYTKYETLCLEDLLL